MTTLTLSLNHFKYLMIISSVLSYATKSALYLMYLFEVAAKVKSVDKMKE